jgi:catechol 2,3-dioxygenase-like lactoylglutathione lyase family enzyme
MNQYLALVALLVNDYDEAIHFYTTRLNFRLLEDTSLSPAKRWVVVAPQGPNHGALLLAKAADDAQRAAVGNQTGGRVFLFLHTDHFDRDYHRFRENGIRFIGEPRLEPYGKVVVFADLYGNRWDLIQPDYTQAHVAPG